MVANADPFEVGVAGLGTSDFIGFGIDVKTVTIIFAPRTNVVIMEFKIQGNTTRLHLAVNDRKFLLDAITMYLDSFEAKTLVNDNKTNKAYGVRKWFMEWGMLTLNARASARVNVGYEFKSNAPYFVLTVPEVPNDLYNKGSVVKRSGYFKLFFTRSQLAEFGEMLIQEYLLSTLDDKNVSRASIDPDVY